MFVFKVFYSIKEGQAQTKLNDLEAYENQKQAFRNQLTQIDNATTALDIFAQDYDEKIILFCNRADFLNKRLEGINEKIKELSATNSLQSNFEQFKEPHYTQIANRLRERKKVVLKNYNKEI